MFEHMEKWLGGLGPEETQTIIQALTKVGFFYPKEECDHSLSHI